MFFKDLAERALKTAAQTFVPTFTAAFVLPSDVYDVNGWKAALIAAGASAVTATLSAVTSLASRKVGDPESASLVKP